MSTAGARQRTRVPLGRLALAISSVAGPVAVGLEQPLLDLYGKNPEIFSAAKLSPSSVIGFAILVALGPVVLWAIVALPLIWVPRAFHLWQAAGIGAGGALTALVLTRKADQAASVAVPAAAIALLLLGFLAFRFAAIRSVATLMGLLAPVAVALFLFSSPVSRYVWAKPAKVPTLRADQITSRPTIIWLVFDETNLGLLLDASGNIDAKRYPNLAALTRSSTWYRNAVGIDNYTPRAVPGLLASRDGSGTAIPTPLDFPTNAFSVLGGQYLVDAVEPVTDLCRGTYCQGVPGAPAASRTSLRPFLHDAAVVYGKIALPRELSDRLPNISDAWGGFTDGNAALQALTAQDAAEQDDPLAKFRATVGGTGPAHQIAVARSWLQRIAPAERPTLHFLHLILPHRPWALVPDGRYYERDHTTVLTDIPPPEPWRVRTRAARFALQAGAMDEVVGEIVARLKATGLWDSSFLVLSVDHGINFQPGAAVRDPAPDGSLDELYRVPMLIKLPGQASGGVSDAPVSTIDILPTLLGALGVTAPSTLAGIDLSKPVPADRVRQVWAHGTPHDFEPGTSSLFARLRDYDAWFPNATSGWERILAVGPYARLLGSRIPASTPVAAGYRAKVALPKVRRATATTAVALVSVKVQTPGDAPVPDGSIVVAARGRVIGFLGGAVRDGSGWRLEGVVDWRRIDAGNPGLDLFLARGEGSGATLTRLVA